MVLCLFSAIWNSSLFRLSLIVELLQTTEPFQYQTVTLIYHSFIAFFMKKLYFFVVVSNVPVKVIALALLTSISMPPNFFTASWTALEIAPSSRMSTAQGRHFPPASSTTSKLIPISYTVHWPNLLLAFWCVQCSKWCYYTMQQIQNLVYCLNHILFLSIYHWCM